MICDGMFASQNQLNQHLKAFSSKQELRVKLKACAQPKSTFWKMGLIRDHYIVSRRTSKSHHTVLRRLDHWYYKHEFSSIANKISIWILPKFTSSAELKAILSLYVNADPYFLDRECTEGLWSNLAAEI